MEYTAYLSDKIKKEKAMKEELMLSWKKCISMSEFRFYN